MVSYFANEFSNDCWCWCCCCSYVILSFMRDTLLYNVTVGILLICQLLHHKQYSDTVLRVRIAHVERVVDVVDVNDYEEGYSLRGENKKREG